MVRFFILLQVPLLTTFPGIDELELLGEDDFLQDLLESLVKDPNVYTVKEEPGMEGKKGSSQASKKRKFNPDAEKIAAVTEEALRQLDIDLNSQDAKKKRRQIRNRLSAQFHRDRKNAYIKNLEDTSEAKDKQIQALQEQVRSLEAQNTYLKEQLFYYQPGSSSSASCGTTTVSQSSDSDQSVCPTPAQSESPLYQAVENNSFPSMKELVPSRGNPTIPLPIVKTLSLLSVLCVICMSSLSYMDNTTQFGRQSASDFSQTVHNHRRLSNQEEIPTFDELFALPVVNESSSAPSAFLPTTYLRGAQEERNATLNETLSSRMILHSRDLIPFDLPIQYGKDWYFNNDRYKSLSYSKIMMNSGVALFPPSMKFGSRLAAATAAATASSSQHERSVVPAHQYRQPQQMFQHPHQEKFVPMIEDSANDALNPNWPAVTTPPAVLYPTDTKTGETDCSHCTGHHDDAHLLGKLFSQANHVTVTVPATSVRMGKTVQDSEDSTMEGLMEMFNLSLDDDRNHTIRKTVLRDSLNDASVEIDCIILSAKLIMNNPKH
jgi:hypothetical protein